MGDNTTCEVKGSGTIPAKRLKNGVWLDINLENVQYVPFKKNLISVGACSNKGLDISFSNETVKICNKKEIVVQDVKQDNNIYRLFLRPMVTMEANVGSINSMKLWHARLGHVNRRILIETKKKQLAHGLEFNEEEQFFCEDCQYGKSHHLSFKKLNNDRCKTPGEMIHSDVCGLMHITSLGGARFFLLFKDDCTGLRTVYFLKNKSEFFQRFIEFKLVISNKFQRPIQRLRIDNGREYLSTEMRKHLQEKGIIIEATTYIPYCPGQNGISERDNRTIMKSARTMLCTKNVPQFLWAEAVNIYSRCISPKPNGHKSSEEFHAL